MTLSELGTPRACAHLLRSRVACFSACMIDCTLLGRMAWVWAIPVIGYISDPGVIVWAGDKTNIIIIFPNKDYAIEM